MLLTEQSKIWPYSTHSISRTILDLHVTDFTVLRFFRGFYLPWRRRSSLGKKVKTTSNGKYKTVQRENRKDFKGILFSEIQKQRSIEVEQVHLFVRDKAKPKSRSPEF